VPVSRPAVAKLVESLLKIVAQCREPVNPAYTINRVEECASAALSRYQKAKP